MSRTSASVCGGCRTSCARTTLDIFSGSTRGFSRRRRACRQGTRRFAQLQTSGSRWIFAVFGRSFAYSCQSYRPGPRRCSSSTCALFRRTISRVLVPIFVRASRRYLNTSGSTSFGFPLYP